MPDPALTNLACPVCTARLRVVAAEPGITRRVAGRLLRLSSGRCPACGGVIVAFATVPGALPKEIAPASTLAIDRSESDGGSAWVQNARIVAGVAIATAAALLGVWSRFSGLAFAVALLVPASFLALGTFIAVYTWRSRAEGTDPDLAHLRAAELDGARLDLALDPRGYRDV